MNTLQPKIIKGTAIPSLICDFYKTSHRLMYPENTQYLYSTLTPRSNKKAPYLDRVVVFGVQAFLQKYLINYFNDNFFAQNEEDIVTEYRQFISRTLGIQDEGEHIRALHRLGYLPLRIKAIPEGNSVAIRVPVMTVENTHPDFAWLTNYLETLINTSLWLPMVSASMARRYHHTLKAFAEQTCDNFDHLPFQAHDFSMRGMSSLESAETSGAAHLIYFKGTDTIPAISFAEQYYGSPNLIGTSIPASEHSVMSAHNAFHATDEIDTFRYLMKKYPNSMLSIVADTTDFWKNIRETLPKLKEEILARPPNARIVIRPDSGDYLEIICGKNFTETNRALLDVEEKGLIESLWDIFGGTVNSKGYKVLNPCIGAIYGDNITYERAEKIVECLKQKGFASSNIVFGVGSFTYQYQTRDTLGFATKATSAIINGVEKAIFKDPKTDDGTKKSQRGRVKVVDLDHVIDGLTAQSDFSGDKLILAFENGKINPAYHSSFDQVIERAMNSK